MRPRFFLTSLLVLLSFPAWSAEFFYKFDIRIENPAFQTQVREALFSIQQKSPDFVQVVESRFGGKIILKSYTKNQKESEAGFVRFGSVYLNESFLGGKSHQIERTLVHEIAHLIDEKASANPLSFQCGNDNEIDGGLPCRQPLNQSLEFAKIFFWAKGSNLNHLNSRSSDQYEYSSPAEAFAVNAENFFLDTQYACRQPQKAQFYSYVFGLPEKTAACGTKLPLFFSASNGARVQKLDMRRVYDIHYLWAGPGTATMSRFGHAMLRVILCKEGRPVGPECVKDINDHLVINFGANVPDLDINSMTGLTGGYAFAVMATSLMEVVSDYTMGESRDLHSVPLRMNSLQIEKTLRSIAEMMWTFEGRYYFVNFNCATGSLLALQRALPEEKNLMALKVSSPQSLYNYFASAVGYSVHHGNKKELEQKGLFFASAQEKYEKLFSELQKHLRSSYASLKEFRQVPVAARQGIYRRAFELAPETSRKKLVGSAALIEEFLLIKHQTAIKTEELQKMIKASQQSIAKNQTARGDSYLDELSKYRMVMSSFGSPARLIPRRQTYGIPNQTELQAVQSVAERANKSLDESLKSMFTQEQSLQLARAQEQTNLLKWLRSYLKSSAPAPTTPIRASVPFVPSGLLKNELPAAMPAGNPRYSIKF